LFLAARFLVRISVAGEYVLGQHGLVASAAQKALAGLWLKNVTDRIEGGKYTFQDPFFKLWLLKRKK
jgi:hypothetical protein